MRWKVHGRRTMYESDWVNVYLDDVELPDGTHIDHHVLTMPKASQTAVVVNEEVSQALLIRRHRFITDRWGWEVPAGWVEPGENPESSIRRELLEETGYQAGRVERLAEYDAIPGLSSMRFTTWLIKGALKTTDPDGIEASESQWFKIDDISIMLRDGSISDGPSLTALAVFLATHRKTRS